MVRPPSAAEKKTSEKIVGENRRARHDYAISETFECGMVLVGTEVKSLRAGHVSFSDSFGRFDDGELWIFGLKIEPFRFGTHNNHETTRRRKLLLTKKELHRISRALQGTKKTLVPLTILFRNGWCKVVIGIGIGKSSVDKRETLKKRTADREIARAVSTGKATSKR